MSNRTYNLDKHTFPDLDTGIRDKWATDPIPRLVFIIGLHRSGTTFLYESLATALPVAKLTLQDVIFYPQLVHSHLLDGGDTDCRVLESYFKAHQLNDRCGDNIRLSPETAEEYGWCLRRVAGSYQLNGKTRSAFDDLCQKLSFLHRDSQAILLKNPWDTSVADQIAQQFPEAKFIFIRRNPLEILNSELRNALSFGKRRDPLLYLLLNGIPETKVLIGTIRFLRFILSEDTYSRLLSRFLFADIRTNLRGYVSAMENMPPERTIEISYRGLVEDSPGTMSTIADFLGLPLSSAADTIQGERRPGKFHPVIAANEERFRDKLTEEGLEGFLDA